MRGCCGNRECWPEETPPRREFLTAAALGLTGLVAGIAGCAPEDRLVAPGPGDELESLRRVDPKFVGYRESNRYQTGFRDARALASDPDGNLFVAGDRGINMLGGMGGMWTVQDEPSCLAVDGEGRFYVGFGDRIDVLDRGGKLIHAWPSFGQNAIITAIAVHGEDVWVANSGAREITRHRPDGQVVARFGRKDAASNYSGLIVPSPHLDVAIGKDGRLICSNPGMHRLETHADDGSLVSSWGEPASTLDGFCGCCNPTDFALFPDGRFVTAEKGIPRVKVYSREGKFLSVVATPDSFPSATMGLDLAVSPDNRHVYVLEQKDRVVRVYEPIEGKAA